MKRNKGFTLIELLVVIAIIGVLASVVLASLNSARNKGSDAAIKSGLANMRSEAEIYYDTNSGYTAGVLAAAVGPTAAVCSTASSVFTDPTFITAISNLNSTSGSATLCSLGVTGTTGKATSWAMSTPLKTSGNWCVDSLGSAKAGTADATGKCV
jgi:prepilin-type N-terminal cleavage/methylation domain-containing protein